MKDEYDVIVVGAGQQVPSPPEMRPPNVMCCFSRNGRRLGSLLGVQKVCHSGNRPFFQNRSLNTFNPMQSGLQVRYDEFELPVLTARPLKYLRTRSESKDRSALSLSENFSIDSLPMMRHEQELM